MAENVLGGQSLFAGVLSKCLRCGLSPRELGVLSACSRECHEVAGEAADNMLRLAQAGRCWRAEASSAPSCLAAAAWSAEHGREPADTLLMAFAQGARWLPAALAVRDISAWMPCRTTRYGQEYQDWFGQDYKDMVDSEEYQVYMSRLSGLCSSHSPGGPQTLWQLVRQMHQERTPRTLYADSWSGMQDKRFTWQWSYSQAELPAEMRRQGAAEVDLLFCLRWHLFAVQEDDLSEPLEKRHMTWRPPTEPHPRWIASGTGAAPRPVVDVAIAAYFVLMAQLGYIDADDGGGTIIEATLARISHREFQKPCLVAFEMLKFGQLHADVLWPEEPPSETGAARLLIRTAALLPARVRNDAIVPSSALGDPDTRQFTTIARRLAHTVQLLVEGSLGHAIQACKDRGCACSCSVVPTASSMCFEVPQPSVAPLVSHLLSYSGPPDDFVQDLKEQFWYCEDPLDDLHRAFRFWAEVYACIERFPDLSQQELWLEIPWDASAELLHHRCELLGCSV